MTAEESANTLELSVEPPPRAGASGSTAAAPMFKLAGSSFITPGFLRIDILNHLGVPSENFDLKWFVSAGTYESGVQGIMKDVRGDPDAAYKLTLHADGKRFGWKADLRFRIPSDWPEHPQISKWLTCRLELDASSVDSCDTLHDQLALAEKLPGWSGLLRNGSVDLSYMDSLQQILQMMHYGIPPAKARTSPSNIKSHFHRAMFAVICSEFYVVPAFVATMCCFFCAVHVFVHRRLISCILSHCHHAC
jgi:hypothetical protein